MSSTSTSTPPRSDEEDVDEQVRVLEERLSELEANRERSLSTLDEKLVAANTELEDLREKARELTTSLRALKAEEQDTILHPEMSGLKGALKLGVHAALLVGGAIPLLRAHHDRLLAFAFGAWVVSLIVAAVRRRL